MKQFVLDTNILIESPDAIWGFDDNVVCITQKLLKNLMDLKRFQGIQVSMQEEQSVILIL